MNSLQQRIGRKSLSWEQQSDRTRENKISKLWKIIKKEMDDCFLSLKKLLEDSNIPFSNFNLSAQLNLLTGEKRERCLTIGNGEVKKKKANRYGCNCI
jgi:hypothetical protein